MKMILLQVQGFSSILSKKRALLFEKTSDRH
jgi:hypothetical protein